MAPNEEKPTGTDTLFATAYAKYINEEDIDGALALCEEILRDTPSHLPARMLVGAHLADSNDRDRSLLGREHFMSAIKLASALDIKKSWPEENPFSQIGIWESDNGRKDYSALLFLLDFLATKSRSSRNFCLEYISLIYGQDLAQEFSLIMDKAVDVAAS
ncbi:hypothetical protein JCM19000A_05570 [Silvimonas sp. JCM 19000]